MRDSAGQLHEFHADRVVLACGAIGTSRLVLGSLNMYDKSVELSEAVPSVLPFFSLEGVTDPRATDDFTLNQFNIALDLDGQGHDISQLHFYTFDPAFEQALPKFLHGKWARRPRRELLRRLSVALGYLPSWGSPGFKIRVRPGPRGRLLPPLEISGGVPRVPPQLDAPPDRSADRGRGASIGSMASPPNVADVGRWQELPLGCNVPSWHLGHESYEQ